MAMPTMKDRNRLFWQFDADRSGNMPLAAVDLVHLPSNPVTCTFVHGQLAVQCCSNCQIYNIYALISTCSWLQAIQTQYPGFRNRLAMMLAFRTADTESKGVVGMRGFRFCLEYLIYFNSTWDTIEDIDTSREGRITLQDLIRSALSAASQFSVRARFVCHSGNG